MLKDNVFLIDKLYSMKKRALKMAFNVGKNGSHLGGGFSCMEILAVLYLKTMDLDKDRFYISKAHGVLAYYTALREVGYLTDEDIENFEKNGSKFPGHPIRNIEKNIIYSGGSLGMALSVAVGSAYHLKKVNNTAKVYVLLGDGECQEGSIWEAVMLASHLKLSNLICIIDKNKLQYDDTTSNLLSIQDFSKRFGSFNWQTIKVDGHNIDELVKVFDTKTDDRPLLVEAETFKGNSISFMHDNVEYHHNTLGEKDYKLALEELYKEYKDYAIN